MDMDEEDQEKVQWMRSVYREVPLDSPVLKRVKASDIHRELKLRYAVHCSHHREAGLVQRAFPNVESKVAGNELQEQEPDVYAFFVRLAWECRDNCLSG